MADNFRVNSTEIVSFVFPSHVQHPIAAGRLFAYGFCGPLDADGLLRSGRRGNRIVLDYELEEMCLQYEREDIISIYLHRPSDLGLLSLKEQEMIINQADSNLKIAKGKTLLPALTKNELTSFLADIPTNEGGLLSFHDVQNAIEEFRRARIKRLKLVYPNLVKKAKKTSSHTAPIGHTLQQSSSMFRRSLANNGTNKPSATSTSRFSSSGPGLANTNSLTLSQQHTTSHKSKVSSAVAPPSMFQRMQGHTNPEVTEQVRQESKYFN
jgi:hypothetical protein